MSFEGLIRAQLEIWPPEPTPRPGRPGRGVPRRRRRRRVPWRLPGFGGIRPATRRAAVTWSGSVSTSTATNDPTISSFDLGSSGSDKIVVCVVTVSGSGAAVNSVTIDGVTATIQENVVVNSLYRVAIAYRVMGSDTGTIAISADTDNSFGGAVLRAYYCTGADQTTPIEDSDNGSSTSATSISLTLTSQTDGLVVDGLVTGDGATAWDEDTGQTEIGAPTASSGTFDHTHHTSSEAGATSVTVGWSGSTETVAQVAMSIAPVGVAAVPTISNAYGSRGSGQSGELIPGADNLTISGTNYGATQGTGDVWLADSATFATANKVAQEINSWSDTSITTYGTNIGSLLSGQSGTLYMFVENDDDEVNATAYEVYVAHRDVRVVSGVFTTPGTTGNFDVSHPRLTDSKVKAIILWTTGQSSEDTAQGNWYLSRGISDGTNSRAIHVFSQDNVLQASANTGRERWTDRVLHQETVGGTDENVATFVGSIAGGFRLNFSTATSGRRVHWMALAGEDVTCTVGSATVSAGSVTGLSHRPEFGWVQSFCDVTGDPGEVFGTQTCGCFNDVVEQQYWSCYLGNGSSDQAVKSAVASDDGCAAQVFQGSTTWEMAISAVTDTSFSWTGTNADGFDYLVADLSGIRTKIGQITKTTTAAPVDQALPALGFAPQLLALVGAQRTTESEAAGDVSVSFGVCDTGSQAAVSATDQNNVATLNNYSRTSDGLIYCAMTPSSGAVAAEAYAYPLDGDQTPEIRWTTNDSDADVINYLAVEHPEGGNDKPRGIRPNVFSW